MNSIQELEDSATLASLPIDHRIGTVATKGGEITARAALKNFLGETLEKYSYDRSGRFLGPCGI